MRIRRVALALLASGLAGCLPNLRTIPGSPAAAIDQSDGGSVSVQTREGETWRLVHARVVGDSIVGTALPDSGNRVAIPLADVASVSVVKWEASGLAAVLVVTLGASLLIFYVVLHLPRVSH